MTTPKVSIIIPNYNHARFVKQRIESVLNQIFQDFELILLDDCSADNSKLVMEEYSKHPKVSTIVCNEKNSGSPFIQWKKGIDLARGEFIWIAESDDWAEPTFLSKLVAEIEQQNNQGVAYCQSYDVDDMDIILNSRIDWTANFEPNIWKSSFKQEGEKIVPYLFIKNIIPNASACIVKKDILSEAIDELLKMKPTEMCGDWFVWLFIAKNNFEFSFVPEHLNYFRHHVNTSRNHNSFEKKQNRILEEARIFMALSEGLKLDKIKQNNLLKSWSILFDEKKLNWSFFDICVALRISKLELVFFYMKTKIWRRS